MLTALGYFVLEYREEHSLAVAWLLGVSGSQIAFGAAALRRGSIVRMGSLLVALGLGISALAFAAAFDGPVLVIGWAVEAIVLAYLATLADDTPSDSLSNAERLAIASAGLLGAASATCSCWRRRRRRCSTGSKTSVRRCSGRRMLRGRRRMRASGAKDPAARCAGRGIRRRGRARHLGSVAIVDTVGVTADGEARQAGQVGSRPSGA